MKRFCCICFFFLSVSCWADTELILFQPLESLVPVEVMTGTCRQLSIEDNRSDAWQCESTDQSKKRVFDPCFIKIENNKKTALCATSPWKNDAVSITLDKAWQPNMRESDEERLDMSADDPWAIELANGVRCLKTTTTTKTINGQLVKYTCDNQGVLLGRLQRCELIWTVMFAPSPDSSRLHFVEIAHVWF